MLSEYVKYVFAKLRMGSNPAARASGRARRDPREPVFRGDMRIPEVSGMPPRGTSLGSPARNRPASEGFAVLVFRSVLFNVLFYLNLLVQMVAACRPW